MIAAKYKPPGLTMLLDHFDWAGHTLVSSPMRIILKSASRAEPGINIIPIALPKVRHSNL